MPRLRQRMPKLLTAGMCASVCFLIAQAPAPALVGSEHSPVGDWVAEHPSKGGIGSWWDFRADGTLTMSFGVVVAEHIERANGAFTVPSGTAGGEPIRYTYTIADNILTVGTPPNSPMTYKRLGTVPDAEDPLIGSWRPLPDPNASPNNSNAVMLQRLTTTRGVLAFTSSNMRYLRIPFGVKSGVWDIQSQTFRLQSDPTNYTFKREAAKLILAQPPDGKQTDSYLPDPLSPPPPARPPPSSFRPQTP